MSGLAWAYRKGSASPLPNVGVALVGKSTTIHAGDVLIKTNVSTRNTGGVSGPAVVRPLNSGDTVTTSNGIFGVALFDIATDANGVLTTVSSPVTVDNRGKLDVVNQLLNVLPPDPASGFIQIYLALFDEQNVFSGLTKANERASYYDVGRNIHITCSAAADGGNYTLDAPAASTNAPLICDGVDTDHPQYNSANGGGRLFVYALRTFDQGANGNIWAT